MATIDKSVCELCEWNGKCKHISNCKSNELGINVKKQAIDKACEAFCNVCQTKECGGKGTKHCLWLTRFKKALEE